MWHNHYTTQMSKWRRNFRYQKNVANRKNISTSTFWRRYFDVEIFILFQSFFDVEISTFFTTFYQISGWTRTWMLNGSIYYVLYLQILCGAEMRYKNPERASKLPNQIQLMPSISKSLGRIIKAFFSVSHKYHCPKNNLLKMELISSSWWLNVIVVVDVLVHMFSYWFYYWPFVLLVMMLHTCILIIVIVIIIYLF